MSGAVPPPAARPLERAARVPRPVCPGCGRYGRVYPAPAPQRAPLRAGVARCGGGGRASPGGVPSTVVRGACCQALSLPRPPVLWSGQPGFRDPCVPGAVDAGVWTQHRPHSVRPCGPALLAVGVAEGRPRVGCLPPCCEGRLVSGAVPPPTARPLERGSATRVSRVRSMRACEPSTGPPACALAGRRCSLWGWRKGAPGGGAFHRCVGRLVSGAVLPPTARPPERAARVPQPLCPGCGRCGRVDPAPAPQRAPLRAGVARCGGGGRASPGGVPSTVVRGAWCQALSLPWPPVLWSGQPGFRDPCVPGAVDAGVWTQHRPHRVRPCGPALLAVGVAEGRPRGGCLPPLCGAPGVRRCPSPDRPSSGAGSQGSATRVSRVRSMRACGPCTGPTACALAGRRCSLWGWRKGVPGGGAFHRCEGRLVSGAVPPPAARPLERAARVPQPVCPGCGRCGRVDPAPAPQRAPLRAGVARCGGGGRASPGGGLFRRCEGRLVSGAVPPPAARPLERAARVPQPVCPGCGRCGRVDPAPAPQRAPLRAGVARCGGGGRASPGGVPSTVVRGAWCQALSLPRPPVLWSGQPGFRNPCVPGAVDAGVWTLHQPHSVRPCGPALLAVGVAEGRPRGGFPPPL